MTKSIYLFIFLSCLQHAFAENKSLGVDDVLTSVRRQYPPLLAIQLQRDIALGKVRRAEGAFDPILSAALMTRPANYYDGSNAQFMLEQPLSNSGGKIYGGYRISSGFLADYDRKFRTASRGEAVLGATLPMLRNRLIDSRRAKLSKAQIDLELAKPMILNQRLRFLRSARIAYYNWLSAGMRYAKTEDLLSVTQEREIFLEKKIKEGAIAKIVQMDNQRLLVSRQIALVKAKRGFEAASIALSLFHRSARSGKPIQPTRKQLPKNFPALELFDKSDLINDRRRALSIRPEIREIALLEAKAKVDLRLAKNNHKPNVDFSIELNQALGGNRPSDIDSTELTALLNFSIPIGRNEAKGRLQVVGAHITQLGKEKEFVKEQVTADVNDSFSALLAAYDTLDQTRRNVELSIKLEEAENFKFKNGASDLLALQIREKDTFDARLIRIEALNSYFKAAADYYAAAAKDAPKNYR